MYITTLIFTQAKPHVVVRRHVGTDLVARRHVHSEVGRAHGVHVSSLADASIFPAVSPRGYMAVMAALQGGV
jgi:hypothetical protein